MDQQLIAGKVRWLQFLVARRADPRFQGALQKEREMELQNPSKSSEVHFLLVR